MSAAHPRTDFREPQGAAQIGEKNVKNDCGAFLTDIELRNRSGIIMGVVGHINGNDAMLRRSAQLILVTENDHFAGKAVTALDNDNHKSENLRPGGVFVLLLWSTLSIARP